MKRNFAWMLAAIYVFSLWGCVREKPEQVDAANVSEYPQMVDKYTLVGEKSFLNGYESLNGDSTINVVVEIPTGSNAKWEVDKTDGSMKWEFKNGKPRVVKYLGYPGNYGMIPQTILPKELGGDGDPLDVIVLGPAFPRGSVVKARIIGVLRLLDGGDQDDKLIAVMKDAPLENVRNLGELNETFQGVSTILETWFSNYKGPGEMEANGFGDVKEAWEILNAAIESYQARPEPQTIEVSH
jgi:inorganic pyrophosphatase